MMKITKNQSGFTLIELLLYLALVAIILGAIISFLSLALSVRSKTKVMSEVEQQGIYLMERIKISIASSTAINYPIFGNASSSLSLAFSNDINRNPTIFYLSGTDLLVKYGVDVPLSLNDGSVKISNLNFSNVSRINTKDLIRFNFTIGYNASSSALADFKYSKTFYGSMSRKP